MAFFLVSLTLIGLCYGYSGWRLIAPAPLTPNLQLVAAAFVLGLAALPHFSFWLRHRLPRQNGWTDAVNWAAYLSMGFFALTFFLLACRDMLWGLWRVAALLSAAIAAPDPVWLHGANMGTLALSVGLAGYGFLQARGKSRVARLDVPLTGLHPSLQGFRIVQISDLHVGPTIKAPFVASVVDQVNALNPDLIAFTGDLADGDVDRLWPHVAPLQGLKAPHGVFFVTGNHEYYSGVEQWVGAATRLGFEVLLNAHRLIERDGGRLLVAGVTDFGGDEYGAAHASDPQAALTGAPPHDLRLLLAHQPRSIDAAAAAGFDLQLSGHTHGGQFIPWKFVIPLQQPYVAGLHRHQGTWLYVSRGTGYWGPPMRLGAPPEISLITLSEA